MFFRCNHGYNTEMKSEYDTLLQFLPLRAGFTSVFALNQLLFAAYVEYQRLTDRVKEFADVSTCCSNTSNMCFFAAIMDTTLK